MSINEPVSNATVQTNTTTKKEKHLDKVPNTPKINKKITAKIDPPQCNLLDLLLAIHDVSGDFPINSIEPLFKFADSVHCVSHTTSYDEFVRLVGYVNDRSNYN